RNGTNAGMRHLRSASRIYRQSQNALGLSELERRWGSSAVSGQCEISQDGTYEGASRAFSLLQNVAALMLQAGHPALLATGLVAILQDVGTVSCAAAVARGDDGAEQVLEAFGTPAPDA